VTEWLPEFERRFRSVAAPHGRFVTGHSSGGWSSLWVQVSHPDVFGGVWSTAPDPIDFRDFSRIDVYRRGENAYRDPAGHRRPIARKGESEVRLWLDDFDHMETVLGPGGQMQSFEAVFSPRGDHGAPRPLWSRTTGEIDPVTARAWEAYDINLVLERNWPTLGPKLRGKLHIHMGEIDTFLPRRGDETGRRDTAAPGERRRRRAAPRQRSRFANDDRTPRPPPPRDGGNVPPQRTLKEGSMIPVAT